MICKWIRPILFGWAAQEEWDRRVMWHIWRSGELHARDWWGNMRERKHSQSYIGG